MQKRNTSKRLRNAIISLAIKQSKNKLSLIIICLLASGALVALVFHLSGDSRTNTVGQDGDTEFRIKSFACGFESIEVEGPARGQLGPQPAQNGQFCILDFQATLLVRPTTSESIFSDSPTAIGANKRIVYSALEVGLNDPEPDGYCRFQLSPNEPRDCRAYFDVPTDVAITQIRFRDDRNSIIKMGGVVLDLP